MSDVKVPRLDDLLGAIRGEVAVAISGGVDSMTLATAAFAARGGEGVRLYHAVSPAVPPDATARTSALAAARDWPLTIFDAGEFSDRDYLANPVNRCFFCKTNLYAAVSARVPAGAVVVSGTNLDDLGEYRPGLDAAARAGVRHPFVEARIGKADVRVLARALGLGEIAELPSSPCLASRVETGLPIDPRALLTINAAERLVRDRLSPRTVRCRQRASGPVIELDQEALASLDPDASGALADALADILGTRPRFAAYRVGSAFLHAAPR